MGVDSTERGERRAAEAVIEPTLGADAVEDAFEAHAHAENVVRMRRMLAYAMLGWLANVGFDVIGVRMLGQGRLAVILGLRGVAMLNFVAVLLRLHVPPRPTVLVFRGLSLVVMISACVSMALMAVEQGTVASAYAHGVSVGLVAHGLAFQEPWRRGAVLAGVPVLAFLVVLLGASLFSPRLAADLASPASTGVFLQNVLLVVITGAFVVTGGHIVHQMRQQAFMQRGLGRYRLIERIARGGMGEIWRAHHAALDREVAVKIIRPDRASASAATARFEREVRALSELKHPSIVRILDYGSTSEGLRYFAMELLDGESLEARLAGGRSLPPARAVAIARDVARALAEAHLRGIVHRDITPGNVFLVTLATGEELVKVLDFGIAKPQDTEEDATTLTAHGKIVGTPTYMAPEQARGVAVDARTDVYALGAVLFRMMCGRAPFEKASHAETLQAHVWDAPPKPSAVADVPPELDAIVLQCLRKTPSERFASAGALADALDGFLRAPASPLAPGSEPPETIDAPSELARARDAEETSDG